MSGAVFGPWLFIIGGIALVLALLLRLWSSSQPRPRRTDDIQQTQPMALEPHRQAPTQGFGLTRYQIWGIILATIPGAIGAQAIRTGGEFWPNFLIPLLGLAALAAVVEYFIYISKN